MQPIPVNAFFQKTVPFSEKIQAQDTFERHQ
jgi:hypothetical protein